MLSLDACYEFCRRIALGHYENFPVGSMLLPKGVRTHIYALYAFMRTADDIADEPGRTTETRLAQLQSFRNDLTAGSDDPVIRAVRNTLEVRRLPIELLLRMLEAFEFDARGEVQFETFDALRWYTARSAEPVGELILALFGYNDPERIRLSNEITTALQLLNFLQDIREDLAQGRCYIPLEDLDRFGISRDAILTDVHSERLLAFEASRVGTMLEEGRRLPEMVHGRLRFELRAIVLGAQTVLQKMTVARFPQLQAAGFVPKLTKQERFSVLVHALIGGTL